MVAADFCGRHKLDFKRKAVKYLHHTSLCTCVLQVEIEYLIRVLLTHHNRLYG